MLHTKFRENRHAGSGEEDFLRVFTIYGMKHTVQEFLLHHDLLGVQIFHIMEKGLFIVQMIKSKANNACLRGQDN